jgi:LysM repeat protein
MAIGKLMSKGVKRISKDLMPLPGKKRKQKEAERAAKPSRKAVRAKSQQASKTGQIATNKNTGKTVGTITRVTSKGERKTVGPKQTEAVESAVKKRQRRRAATKIAAITGLASAVTGMSGSDKSYTIKSGDTLSQIAKKYGTTLEKLLDANPQFRGKDAAGRAKANRIKPGQKISLSGIVSPRKSVYQDTTKKEMSDMQMPKRKGGKVTYKKHGGKVGGSDGNKLVASCYD